jgi:hypothetical protein
MKLKKILCLSIFALLLALFFLIPMSVSLENSEVCYSVSEDQILYFQGEEVDLGDHGRAFLLTTDHVNGGVMEEAHQARFVSLPLVSNFTFLNLTVTVYHASIPSTGYQLLIKVGWLDLLNQSHGSHFDYENLEVGAQVISHSFAVDCCGIKVSEGQRLWLELQTSSPDIKFFWGEPAHNSRVAYNGIASFIPEFPSFLVLPILMVFSLIAVVLRKKKAN